MHRSFLCSIVLLILAGCNDAEPGKPAATPTPTAPPAPAFTPPPAPKLPTDATEAEAKPADAQAAEAKKAEAKRTEAKPAESEQRPGTTLGKAESGVGAKGHYGEGIITTPVSTIFRAQEMVAFKIQIPQAMQLFRATYDRPPKDNEEFMQKIIKENQIALPELPPGQRFLYDAKTQELMVERPAQ